MFPHIVGNATTVQAYGRQGLGHFRRRHGFARKDTRAHDCEGIQGITQSVLAFGEQYA